MQSRSLFRAQTEEGSAWVARYSGPSLLEYLDNLPINDRKMNAPFMLPVSEKYNEMGTIVVGKIETGRVKKGDSLLLMPNKVSYERSP